MVWKSFTADVHLPQLGSPPEPHKKKSFPKNYTDSEQGIGKLSDSIPTASSYSEHRNQNHKRQGADEES